MVLTAMPNRPANTDSIHVPRMSRFVGAFGLLYESGQSPTQSSNTPALLRNSAKNANCPMGVALESVSHFHLRASPPYC